MDRGTFKRLAEVRLTEARSLLAARQWSGAYYLSGYAVECGLKAKLVTQFLRWQLPDKQQVQRAYTHNLDELVRLSGLEAELEAARTRPEFNVNWTLVKDWSESSRYSTWSRAQAIELVDAVGDAQEGVLPWLRQRW